MALYKLTLNPDVVRRTADGAWVPVVNTEYIAWLAGGGVPDATDPAPPAPTLDEIYDQSVLTQQVLKAVVLSIISGTLVNGMTPAQAKAVIKAKM